MSVYWLIPVAWCGLGLLSVPGDLAYWCREFPTSSPRENLGTAIASALVWGPMWLFISFLSSGFYRHGFMFKLPPEPRQRSR